MQLTLPLFTVEAPEAPAKKRRKASKPVLRVTMAPPAPPSPPPDPSPVPAAPDPIEAFLGRCANRGLSPHTIRSYRTDLTKALGGCGPLLAATERQIEAFLASETQRGLHPGTVGRRLNTLRSFYRDARRQKLMMEDPTVALDAPRKPKRLPKYLKSEEIAAMLAALRSETLMDLREAAIVLTLYNTGMRISEAVGLNVDQVSGEIVRVFGKGSKEREIPIPKALRDGLDAWLAVHPGGPALFCSLGNDPGRLSTCQARAIVKGVFKRAGLTRMRFTPHTLRHSYASTLLNKGMRMDIIQKLLGHAGINTTQGYAHTEFSQDLRNQLSAYLQA